AIVASDDERGPLLQPDRDVPQKPEILDLNMFDSHAFPPLIRPTLSVAIISVPTTSFARIGCSMTASASVTVLLEKLKQRLQLGEQLIKCNDDLVLQSIAEEFKGFPFGFVSGIAACD